jgi:uncharacterized protein
MKKLLYLIALCLISVNVWALDIYQGEAPVANQSADERVRALGKALLDVAVKVSGDASAASNGTIISASGSPERYMQRYEYRQEIVRENGAPAVKLFLKGTFHQPSITQLLTRAGIGAWGRNRPTVAVYVFRDGSPLPVDIQESMRDKSSARGVNVRFPDGIGASEASEETALRLGSPNQHALVGRVNETLWLSDGRTVEALSSSALDGLSDRLASTLVRRDAAIRNAPPEELQAEVAGIRNANDYSSALKYLSALSGVKKLTVVGAAGNALKLRLSVQGGVDRLASGVSSGNTMRVLSEDPIVLEMGN